MGRTGRLVLCALALFGAACQTPAPPVGFAVLGRQAPAWAEAIRIPDGYTETRHSTHTVALAASSEEEARGHVLFRKHYLEHVYPYTTPARSEITDALRIVASRGEYEPATFSIHALKQLKQLKVDVSALRGPGLSVIHPAHIDVRSVRCWPRRVWKNPPVAEYTIDPWFLERRAVLDLPSRSSQRFWLTLHIPPAARAGVYTGEVRITGAGMPPSVLKLEAEVLPIALVEPPTRQGMYYHMFNDRVPGPGTPYPDAYLYKEIMNMRAHGMNTVFPILYPEVKGTLHPDGRITYDLTPIAYFVETCLAAGMDAGLWNTTVDGLLEGHGGPSTTAANVRGFYDSFTARGWPPPVISYGDESDAHGQTKEIYRTLGQIKDAVPEARTYTTIVWPDSSEMFEPHVDIRSFSSYLDAVASKRTREAGRTLWMYSGPSAWGPQKNRFYRGLWGCALDLDGILDRVYFSICDAGQIFNDLKKRNGGPNHRNWVLPTEEGPLPTVTWEAIREGVDDSRYVHTLRLAIQRARRLDDASKRAPADDADAFLRDALTRIDTGPADTSVYPLNRSCDQLSVGFLDELRGTLARYIVGLQ